MKEQSEPVPVLLPDYRVIFERLPGLYLIVDTGFIIVAQNDAHARATLTNRHETVGRSLFEIFPDNPSDYNADGLSALRSSLLSVIKTRLPDEMPLLKYDVQRTGDNGAGFERRYWRVVNTPVLGDDGFVSFIINQAEDITEITQLRQRLGILTNP